MIIKNYQDVREHFISRLKERYELDITEDEYDSFCNAKYVSENFTGMFKKNTAKTIGYLNIKNNSVIVMYDNDPYNNDKKHQFPTCFPQDSDKDIHSMFKLCFGVINYNIENENYKTFLTFLLECREFEKLKNGLDEKTLFTKTNFIFKHILVDLLKYNDFNFWKLMRIIRNFNKNNN